MLDIKSEGQPLIAEMKGNQGLSFLLNKTPGCAGGSEKVITYENSKRTPFDVE